VYELPYQGRNINIGTWSFRLRVPRKADGLMTSLAESSEQELAEEKNKKRRRKNEE
jgi:hypothetical protein